MMRHRQRRKEKLQESRVQTTLMNLQWHVSGSQWAILLEIPGSVDAKQVVIGSRRVAEPRLNVWLVKTGEPSPVDGGGRLMRTAMLADELVRSGHRVTWWDSCFSHQQKTFRFRETTGIKLPNGVDIQFLLGRGYRRHLSWARFNDHRQVAASFASMAQSKPQPDIVVAPYPTVELCAASANYAKQRNIPLLVDIRDLVPDSIPEYFHPALRPVVRAALLPYEKAARRALAAADGIVGITDDFLEWGLAKAGRRRTTFDAVVHHCYDANAVTPAQIEIASERWRALGITPEAGKIVCFFGVVSDTHDFGTVLQGIRRARNALSTALFVFCGTGPTLEKIRKRAVDLSNVYFPGQVDAASVVALMQISRFGIAPYRSTVNYVGNIPNKFIEYMSMGLPVISPLRGAVRRLIDDEGIGFSYSERDPAGFQRAMTSALNMPDDDYRAMRSGISTIFDRRFSRGVVMDKFVKHIERVAGFHLD